MNIIGIFVLVMTLMVPFLDGCSGFVAVTRLPDRHHFLSTSQRRNSVVVKMNSIGLADVVTTQQAVSTLVEPSSTMTLSDAITLDPTTFLSNVFGSVLGTPLILAIPIVAALGVASLFVYLLFSYASPAEEED
jgi:hypothetical protein